jgi:cullin-5
MPADYVNKLARMFQDIKVSEDLNQQFKEQYRSTRGSIAGEYIYIKLLLYIKFVFSNCRSVLTN